MILLIMYLTISKHYDYHLVLIKKNILNFPIIQNISLRVISCGIFSILCWISALSPSVVHGLFSQTLFFKYPHRKKSKMERSGELPGHGILPPNESKRPGNCRKFLELKLKIVLYEYEQDVATAYISRKSMEVLRQLFPGRLISYIQVSYTTYASSENQHDYQKLLKEFIFVIVCVPRFS